MENMVYAKNKKAFYEYFVGDKFEAGIALKGNEVCSVKQNGCSITGAWILIENGEAFLYGFNIPQYEQSSVFAADPLRPKKLLLHKKELAKLANETIAKGSAIIPLSVYCKNGLVKVEIALCAGKKKYDKRQSIAKRDSDRKIANSLKQSLNK